MHRGRRISSAILNGKAPLDEVKNSRYLFALRCQAPWVVNRHTCPFSGSQIPPPEARFFIEKSLQPPIGILHFAQTACGAFKLKRPCAFDIEHLRLRRRRRDQPDLRLV